MSPLSFGGVEYQSKRAVADHASAMLRGADLDDPFLSDLLRRHPEAEQKIGCGVRRFFIGPDGWGGRCFHLERLDGSTTDWSFKACLRPPTKRADALVALRCEIADQIIAFRDRAFASGQVVCAISGAVVTPSTAHVDHIHPDTFSALVEQFCAHEGVDLGSLEVAPTEDNDTRSRLTDRRIAEAWQTFHAERAQLRILAARINCRIGARAS